MKKFSLFLAVAILLSCCFVGLVGCEKEAASGEGTSEQEATTPAKTEVKMCIRDRSCTISL